MFSKEVAKQLREEFWDQFLTKTSPGAATVWKLLHCCVWYYQISTINKWHPVNYPDTVLYHYLPLNIAFSSSARLICCSILCI